MKRLSFSSINTVVSFFVGIVLFAAITVFVIYVSRSTYDTVYTVSTEDMEKMSKNLTTNINDMIDSNLGMVRVIALNDNVRLALKSDSVNLDEYFKSLFKSFTGLVSVFMYKTDGVCVSGYTKRGDNLKGTKYGNRPYIQANKEGKDFIFPEIVEAKTTKDYIFITSVPVFDTDGNVLGGVAITVDWAKYIESHILPIKLGKNGYAFILDDKGRLISHPNKEFMLKDMSNLPFIKKAMAQKKGLDRYVFEGVDKVLITDHVERTGWLVGMSATEEDLTAAAVTQRNTLIGVGVATFAALLTVIVLLLRRQVIRPLQNIMAYSARIAAGDFKASLEGQYRYELRKLADNFLETTAVLKNRLGFADGVLKGITFPVLVTDTDVKVVYANEPMIKLVGLSGSPSDFVGQTGAQFFYGDATRQTINARCIAEKKNSLDNESEISFRDGKKHFLRIDVSVIQDLDGQAVGSITLVADLTEIKAQQALIESQQQTVAQVAQQADAISDRVSTATEELSAQIEQSSRGAEVQAQRVSETATAMEEMNASVLEVAKGATGAADTSGLARTKAETGAAMVNKVVQGIEEVRKQAQDLKTNMASLGAQAQNIGQIMNVISDIADQTNLLALNAAIEAARAGEAGRGFAVVADEVRKLAEKTMNATKEVGDAIHGIQNGTNQNVAKVEQTVATIEQTTTLANQSGDALGEIVSLVEQASDQVRSIATAAEQQSATSEEINRAVEEVNRISAETSEAMSQSASAVTELARQAQELRDLILHMQDSGVGSALSAGAGALPGGKSTPRLAAKAALSAKKPAALPSR